MQVASGNARRTRILDATRMRAKIHDYFKERTRLGGDAAGRRWWPATVLDEVAAFIQPGVTTRQVDDFAAARIKAQGAKSAFLGYRKFPCQICISVNEEVVHGLAGAARVGVWRYCQPGHWRALSRVYRRHGPDGGRGRMRRARRNG